MAVNVTGPQALAGLAVLGALGAGAVGYLSPSEAECEIERARLEERVDALVEVKDTCKEALRSCAGGTP